MIRRGGKSQKEDVDKPSDASKQYIRFVVCNIMVKHARSFPCPILNPV